MKKWLVVVLGLMLFLVGCESKQEKQLEGTWENVDKGGTWATIEGNTMVVAGKEFEMFNIDTSLENVIAFDTYYENEDATLTFRVDFDKDDKNKASVVALHTDSMSTNSFNIKKESSQGMSYPMRWFIFIGGAVAIYYILRAFINNKN